MATYSRVLNFKPDLTGYSQTWRHKTAVFTPENGVTTKDTKRNPILSVTKMDISMKVSPIRQTDNERLENLLRLVFTEDNGVVGVPLWYSVDSLSVNASTASTSITIGIGSTNGEYAIPAGGYRDIMISSGDYTYAFSSTVSNISSGTLTLGSAPNLNYRIGTIVTPIIGMKIRDVVKSAGNRYNARGYSYSFEFEEID